MPIRERLIEVLQVFNSIWHLPESSPQNALRQVREELRSIAREALARERDKVPLVVSLLHVLVDCCRGAVPPDTAREVLQVLAQGRLSPPLRIGTLLGSEITLDTREPLERNGCTLLDWRSFYRWHAWSFGYSRHDQDALEELWRRIEAGVITLAEQDVHLNSDNGVVWFTDENRLRQNCPVATKGQVDGNKAYDELGLDWSLRWDYDEGGKGSARALLLSVSLRRRSEAERGLRVPTSIDGWGCLLFVPRNEDASRGIWPDVGSYTVHPASGESCLPEGVHGPLEIGVGQCFAEACGEVSRAIPKRVDEHGEAVLERAMARLTKP